MTELDLVGHRRITLGTKSVGSMIVSPGLIRYSIHMLISQVITDLKRRCNAAAHLEPLNIFEHAWKYRGEGNANVVVALQDDQRVIRLPKVNVGELVGDLSRRRRKVEREVIFANKIFGPLIGAEFLGSVKAIQLDSDQITRLNEILQHTRPAHRLHKELRVPYATSHSDFARIHSSSCLGETDFCVEIKPKQGWWHNFLTLKSFSESKSDMCTYCMNQFLKLKRSKITSRTWYCPLDLFSGNAQRMIEAIISLIANPQNNFRIFCNGKLVFGEYNDESLETVLQQWMGNADEASSKSEMPSPLNSFIYLLCVSLIRPKNISNDDKTKDIFNNISEQLRIILGATPPSYLYSKIVTKSPQKEKLGSNSESDVRNGSISIVCNRDATLLPEGCILSRILEIQKLADFQKSLKRTDSSIYKMYKRICPVHSIGGVAEKTKLTQLIPSSDYESSSPKLNVVLTGDDSFVDSGTETERMSDSESIEEGFDTSSTEDDEDETIMNIVHFDDNPENGCSSSNSPQQNTSKIQDCPSAACLSCEKWLDEIEYIPLSDDEIMAVEMYLLAATAKDCSILVTFSPKTDTSPEENAHCDHENLDTEIRDLANRRHRVRIGVADLDPKPVTTIVRHYLRDSEMHQAYTSYCNNSSQ